MQETAFFYLAVREKGYTVAYMKDTAQDLHMPPRSRIESCTGRKSYRRKCKVTKNTRSELTSAEMGENTFSWILDNIGNRESASRNGTNRIFEANELNQYASISNGGLRELSYDFDGNLTNDAVFAHSYNGENRLVMSEPLNVTNGSKRVQSAYDYKGRRFRKVVEAWNGSSWASATTNIFVYDGFNLIQEQDGTGGVIRSYIRGLDLSGTLQGAGGTGGLLAMISGSNTYFYLGDANGNITELVDTNGDVVAHYEWDAYGNRLNEPGENEPENPFGFSSQFRDKETGLDMYIFRPYSPELERFVQRDPIGFIGGFNIYAFLGNGAVGKIDRFGLAPARNPFPGAVPDMSPCSLSWEHRMTPQQRDPRVEGWTEAMCNDPKDDGYIESCNDGCGLKYSRVIEPDCSIKIWIRAGHDPLKALPLNPERTTWTHEIQHALHFVEYIKERQKWAERLLPLCVPVDCHSERNAVYSAYEKLFHNRMRAKDFALESDYNPSATGGSFAEGLPDDVKAVDEAWNAFQGCLEEAI